jgi:hypothetical protein
MVVRRPADELRRVGLVKSVRDSHIREYTEGRAEDIHYIHEYTIDEPYIIALVLMVEPTHECQSHDKKNTRQRK